MPHLSAQPVSQSAAPAQSHASVGLWLGTAAWVLVALAVYCGSIALEGDWHSPNVAYFDHLAQAWLRGELHLADPPGRADLTRYEGRWYVPFPPLCAALLLPWVAALGVSGVSTFLFGAIGAALTVGVVWRLLGALETHGWARLGLGVRIALTLMMMIGSVYWYTALQGNVWYLSHVYTVLFVALALYCAASERPPWLVGLLLAVALWGRPNVIFTALLPLALRSERRGEGVFALRSRDWWRDAVLLGVPLVVSSAGLLAYNAARFDNPLDFGYAKQNISAPLQDKLAIGQFHIRHVPRNLHMLLFGPPKWRTDAVLPVPDRWGLSLLLTSPLVVLVYRVWPPRRTWVRGAWITIGLLLIPLLLYYNTGWTQFGYRFSLDFQIPLLMLLGAALGPRAGVVVWALLGVGIVVNAWGVVWSQTSWL